MLPISLLVPTAATTEIIGTIFNRAGFTDLSGLETDGGYTVVDGSVLVAADAMLSNYLRVPVVTCLDRFKVETAFALLSADSNDMGLQIGVQSLNPIDASLYAVFIDNGVNAGKVALYQRSIGALYHSTSALSFTPGDEISLSFEKTRANYIATAFAGGSTVFVSKPIPYAYGMQIVNQNTSRAAILASEGTYRINSFSFSSQDEKNVARLAVGDSITHGSFAGSAAQRWGQIVCDGISAGPSDRVDEVLKHINEMITTIRPVKVFLMIGTNTTTGWQSKYQSAVSQLESAGIEVIKMTPPPRNSRDMSVERDWIVTTYPASYIDCYTPLLGNGTSLNAAFDSGDGTHLNTAGNALIASITTSSPLY